MVNTKMEFKHPKYYAGLRRQAKLQAGKVTSSKQQAIEESVPYTDVIEAQATSSQASGSKHPNQCTRVQASSHKPQAPGSDDQGTSGSSQA